MEVFCSVKTVIENGDSLECSVFILQKWKFESGTIFEQRREDNVVATLELVEQTAKALVFKKTDTSIEFGDILYVEPPVEIVPIVTSPDIDVLVFSGKNWKLASPKKWVPTRLMSSSIESAMKKEKLGETNLLGKNCDVCRITNSLEETIFVAVPRPDNPVNIE
jgi:hypothetical protein